MTIQGATLWCAQPNSDGLVCGFPEQSHENCMAPICGFGRCGVWLTFSAWGPGGPGAPALPGNPGGPCINKEVGKDERRPLPPSFWVGSIYLPDPPWLPMRPCSSGLAPEIYHGHLDCFSHLLHPCPRSQVPGSSSSCRPCSSQWDHMMTGNFCVFTHRWAWEAWLALKSLGEEVRGSACRLDTQVERGTGGGGLKATSFVLPYV